MKKAATLIYAPFKASEMVHIYWVGKLTVDEHRNWCVRVYTKIDDKVWFSLVPIGLWPSMFIGAEFNFGRYTVNKYITNKTISSFNMSRIEFVSFNDMPEKLYSNNYNPALKEEIVCKYKAGKKTYYIPQTEIIRAFFGINSTTIQRLLMPSGLNDLFNVVLYNADQVEIEFNRDFPKNNVNKSTAKLLVTFKFNQILNDFWSSVYLCAKIRKEDRLFIPPDLSVGIDCVCVSAANDYFVKKINKINGLSCPFKEVKFSHPLIDEKVVSQEPVHRDEGKKRKSQGRRQSGNNYGGEVNDDAFASYDVNRTSRNSPGSTVHFGFSGMTEVQQVYHKKSEKNVARHTLFKVGNDEYSNEPHDNQKKYSSGISVGEKAEKPVEFHIDIDDYALHDAMAEFDSFVDAVKSLGAREESIKVAELYGNTKFVLMDEYTRRKCAIVDLDDIMLIEFARPDKHLIATLLCKSADVLTIKVLKALLLSVVNNNGHWDKQFLKNRLKLNCKFVKHMKNDDVVAFADRLKNSIDAF